MSTLRLLILGGAVAGAELVHGLIRVLSPAEKQEEKKLSPEEERKKQEELKKLLAPSKLLEMVEETNRSALTNARPPLPDKTGSVTRATNQEPADGEEKVAAVVTVTNTETSEIYEFRRGRIDYYAVALAYFKVGKKEKAREFFLKTIAVDYNRDKAVDFLITRYGLSLKDINLEAKKYSEK